MKILMVFGTRPEAIKMCPLVIKLKENSNIDCSICLTGQHKEMIEPIMDSFGIKEDYNLAIMRESQTLTSITTLILNGMESVLEKTNPDIVLVHGDTSSSFAAALAAFYRKIPVGHVEAGLRTGCTYSPYPEEMNRILTDRLAQYHFAPTVNAAENLKGEGIYENVYVTGNTGIDALKYTIKEEYKFKLNILNEIDFNNKRIILITAHRRENHGEGILNICLAIKKIARKYDDVIIVYPVHLNPRVGEIVYDQLGEIDNIILTNPLDVLDMHNFIKKSFLIMTDSGGLQEEAPYLGIPVLVLRNETERVEAVEAGTVKVIGTDEKNIYEVASHFLEDKELYAKVANSTNPYGDGRACEKIVDILLEKFK